MRLIAALIRRIAQAQIPPHLSPILKVAPAKQLLRQREAAAKADPPQLLQALDPGGIRQRLRPQGRLRRPLPAENGSGVVDAL